MDHSSPHLADESYVIYGAGPNRKDILVVPSIAVTLRHEASNIPSDLHSNAAILKDLEAEIIKQGGGQAIPAASLQLAEYIRVYPFGAVTDFFTRTAEQHRKDYEAQLLEELDKAAEDVKQDASGLSDKTKRIRKDAAKKGGNKKSRLFEGFSGM